MTEEYGEMQPIFGRGFPDDYLKLKSSPRGNFAPNRGITNERQLLIKEFYDRLAPEYKKFKGKALSPKIVAVKVGHVSTTELRDFLDRCKKAKNFGACFWGSLKLSTANK